MLAFRAAGLWIVLFLATAPLQAAEPWPPIPRQLPPPGVEIPAADRDRLGAELARLQRHRDDWLASTDGFLKLGLPDVDICLKAVRFALEESEFYGSEDVAAAEDLLQVCASRLDDLAAGRAIWSLARGPVVQGYRSPIDDSVQPYGLVIPEKLDLSKPVPLYVWLHGRNDKLTDLRFISERSRNYGQVHPDDAIVLHPFGRGCLGWKSAAERDVLDAINAVYMRYRIDPKRIVLMGFSMGGAGIWHIGATTPIGSLEYMPVQGSSTSLAIRS